MKRGVNIVKDFTQSVNMGLHWRIMHNAHSYAINTSKMFRYATRRNAAVEIKEIWNESIIYYD